MCNAIHVNNVSHRVSESVQPDHHVFVCATLQKRQERQGVIKKMNVHVVPGIIQHNAELLDVKQPFRDLRGR